MTLREQIQPAWLKFKGTAHFGNWEEAMFAEGYKAALATIANPSDEMVERCAEAMRRVPAYDGDFSVAADAGLTGDEIRNLARACLAAAVGGE